MVSIDLTSSHFQYLYKKCTFLKNAARAITSLSHMRSAQSVLLFTCCHYALDSGVTSRPTLLGYYWQ